MKVCVVAPPTDRFVWFGSRQIETDELLVLLGRISWAMASRMALRNVSVRTLENLFLGFILGNEKFSLCNDSLNWTWNPLNLINRLLSMLIPRSYLARFSEKNLTIPSFGRAPSRQSFSPGKVPIVHIQISCCFYRRFYACANNKSTRTFFIIPRSSTLRFIYMGIVSMWKFSSFPTRNCFPGQSPLVSHWCWLAAGTCTSPSVTWTNSCHS